MKCKVCPTNDSSLAVPTIRIYFKIPSGSFGSKIQCDEHLIELTDENATIFYCIQQLLIKCQSLNDDQTKNRNRSLSTEIWDINYTLLYTAYNSSESISSNKEAISPLVFDDEFSKSHPTGFNLLVLEVSFV